MPPTRISFVLRPDVLIDLRASLAVAATALPQPDTCAWLERELAAAQQERREPRGWLTLREAAAILRQAFHEVYYQLKNIDDDQVGPPKCLRCIGAWEIVPAAAVHLYRTRFNIAARSVDQYADELEAEVARRTAELAPIDACSERWAFSDGTRAGLGGRIAGGSRFASELREAVAHGELLVDWGPHPSGGQRIDASDLPWFDLWLRQQSLRGYWRHMQLKLIERPANVPALPKVHWPRLPPGAIA
jgi:hypothetical protein